jgi:hypothetical protein
MERYSVQSERTGICTYKLSCSTHLVLQGTHQVSVLVPLLQKARGLHINPRHARETLARPLSIPPKHCHTAGTAT